MSGNAERAGQTQPENQGKTGPLTAAKRARSRRTGVRRPDAGRPSLAGGDNSHYPSSWYSKAKKPVRPPTSTGSHAAAIGCINSALLKSSVTFDKT